MIERIAKQRMIVDNDYAMRCHDPDPFRQILERCCCKVAVEDACCAGAKTVLNISLSGGLLIYTIAELTQNEQTSGYSPARLVTATNSVHIAAQTLEDYASSSQQTINPKHKHTCETPAK